MTSEQIELARHALGLDGQRKRSYRNRYVTGPGGSDHPAWLAMVEAGDAKKRDGSTLPFGGDDIFWLTRQGAEKALRKGEKLCPEDFPS
ncbi:hypothetical protein C7451_106102 [Blastomonas natatoria]|uniref:Uncharacterized protein n=1 Tax=Blastomonas natatoria TaxID=34015 RepID=A0A2V3V5C8_9SPHN|nr:hypothetical protein [Blastomonas natatoria]PXW75938.1 hypothetical protein C7451_106102 [Blastomonas natatoria]